MNIGIDGYEANVEHKVGVSVYTLNMLNYFRKRAWSDLRFTVYLRSKPLPDLPEPNAYFSYEIIPGPFLWSQIFLPLHLYTHQKIDVFFSPAHYIPRFCPVPTVVAIHDLSYRFFPDDFLKKDLFKLERLTAYSLKKAKKVIAVSKTTKKDIMNVYNIPDNKIDVVYNGYERKRDSDKGKFKRWTEGKPYLLYVGTLQPRKNIVLLIKAFSQLKNAYPQFELIIAGKKGWLYSKIFEEVSELGLDKDVHFTDYVTDRQLVFLYKNAFCFVLPSLYEGFGIPILEAMSFGCPVVSSFSSSLPEIGGDACLYFDPKDVHDLREKLQMLIENKRMKSQLIQKGNLRVKEFSWEQCGEQTLAVIKSAAKGIS